MEEMCYRWYVVNNQNTCFVDIIELIPGWYSSEKDTKLAVKDKYNFDECLFGVRKIEQTEVPVRFMRKER